MNPSPFTVMVKPGPPATAEVGLMEEMVGDTATIGKLKEFDWVNPGVDTVMEATPSTATKLAGTVAVNCVELTNTVGSAVPTHTTVEPETKRAPFTVSVKPGPPAIAWVGLRLVIWVPYGLGSTTNLMELVATVPGFFTEMPTPTGIAFCTRPAGTVPDK